MDSSPLAVWHQLVESGEMTGLENLLADDVVFHSPVVFTPQEGKELTLMYLTAAFHVLGGDEFVYTREVVNERDAVLEFKALVDGIEVNGVDMIGWNEEGLINDFKVMVRPLKAFNLLHQKMREMLSAMG